METNAAAARSSQRSMRIGDYVATSIHTITSKRYSSTSLARTMYVKAGVPTALPKTQNSIADAVANHQNTGTKRFRFFDNTPPPVLELTTPTDKRDPKTPTNNAVNRSGEVSRFFELIISRRRSVTAVVLAVSRRARAQSRSDGARNRNRNQP